MIEIYKRISEETVKAKARDEPYLYKVGDTIWGYEYLRNELRYVRVPKWKVTSVRTYTKHQNLILEEI